VTDQLSLFGPGSGLPQGFIYQRGFLSEDEERALANRISALPLKPFEFHGFSGKRRVLSFGWRYQFDGSGLHEADSIPDFLMPLRARAAALAGAEPHDLRHILITEYAPGAGIGWHKDRSVFGETVGISLLAPCRFRFRRKAGEKWERAAVNCEPRSAYVLRGLSRTEWEHSIPEVEALRYSITFRNLAAEPG